jgi:DNA polymerase-3 subunit delta'
MSELPLPHERENVFGRADDERRLRAALAGGTLSNGWLIVGQKGAGKATLAYRLARAMLDPAALVDAETLQVPASARVFRLVAGRAHPDLFVAEREVDEKTGRQATEISVDTIRRLNAFLGRTAAGGGWRVAIVDSADDLNRNAANALLKSLEEPPQRTAILLVANAPGRLLATIRSRCRRIQLRPAAHEDVLALLGAELGCKGEEAARIAAASKGLPGYALTLAAGEGGEAASAAATFLQASAGGEDVSRLAGSLASRQAEKKREVFERIILDAISAAACAAASGRPVHGGLEGIAPDRLLAAHEAVERLFGRAEAVNLDHAQTLMAASRLIAAAARGRAA